MEKVSTSTLWSRANPERHREQVRKWNEVNAERVKELRRIRRESGAIKNQSLVSRYGITVEQREAMLDEQGRSCAICKATEPGWKHYWVVDHCHETKRVRSILCHSCNIVLGRVKDDVETLKSMIQYLEKHKSYG